MISENWRVFLYPLGFLPAFIFGIRFIIQWIQSEKAGQSLVPKAFWKLSLLGNIMLFLHSFVQVQFHVCTIQATNAVIAWRNLNLLQTKKQPLTFAKTALILVAVIFLTVMGFVSLSYLESHEHWFRIPSVPWQDTSHSSVSLIWHLAGFFGYALFSSRFWLQWWFAEKQKKSYLPLSFWWVSLIGAFFSCIYFLSISDMVNFLGPAIGLVPYLRNIIIINKSAAPKYE